MLVYRRVPKSLVLLFRQYLCSDREIKSKVFFFWGGLRVVEPGLDILILSIDIYLEFEIWD